MELKDQIRIAREAAGLSQTQLADELKVSRQAVLWWEEGTHRPKTKRIRQVEDVLKIRLDLSERGNAQPLGASRPSPSVDPEILRLAVAISRLPRKQRDAITTLAFIGEKNSLGTKSHSEKNTDQQDAAPLDTIEIERPPEPSGEFDFVEKRKNNEGTSHFEAGATGKVQVPRRNSRKAVG